MLAMDAFLGHLDDRIRNRLRNKKKDLVIIPSGMTSQLQPLDVSLNKPFKHLKYFVVLIDVFKINSLK
jgi:hypothetical protein